MSEPALQDFLVPDLGEGLEDVTVVEWFVAPGDPVDLNQVLCSVETAKAVVEIPSPQRGVVAELGGGEGETLLVGTLLVRFGASDEAVAADSAKRPEPTLVGYGHDDSLDRSNRAAVRAATTTATAPTTAPTGRRPLATPPVRMLARRLGVDLAALAPGAGPGGAVTRAEVEAAAQRPAAQVPAGRPLPAPVADLPDPHDALERVTGVRARIAERMTTSRARIPDATCSVIVDCTRLLEVRGVLNEASRRRGSEPVITPFSLICGLLVRSLKRNNRLNSTYVEDGPVVRLHSSVHLGIGTATPRGLLVPVVRDAGRLSILELAGEMARLRDGARDQTLRPEELTGSTFTVSNFGALGLDEGVPVINYPEAAIVGVGAVRPRPCVVDDQVVARPTATITLAFDHRVCDGAEAAGLLVDLRALIEQPELAILDA